MVSRFLRYIGPAAAAVSLLALSGCAGSKSGSADYSSMDSGSSAAKSSAKLDDARRSAEDAELKAHQLREEKARSQSKTATSN